MILTGDLQKEFLQIRIKQEERDALRVHWRHPNSHKTEIYRFTRALFGLTSSPFLLGGVIQQHLKSWQNRSPDLVKEITDSIYVDDLMEGGVTVEEAKEKKAATTEIFEDATFKIHKWHSKASELEAANDLKYDPVERTLAKQQLGGSRPSEGKLPGLPWDRE